LITNPQQPTTSRTWLGQVLVGIIVVGVALLLYFRADGPPPDSAAHQPSDSTRAVTEFLGFVAVPEGGFVMGSDKSTDPLAFDNERWSPAQPRGEVNLPLFYIGRYEVTVAQYQAFVAASGRTVDPQALTAPANHPVTFVTWPDALAYCRWLENQLETSPNTPAALKELLNAGWHVSVPSEAEWEKAARGTDGRRYPWGDAFRPDRANLTGQGTVPVGSIECPECAYGLSDMSGNVWEWTRSPYQPYPYDPADDSATIGSDALWVMRGGAFGTSDQMGRTTTRAGADPGARRPFIGFRVVLTGVN
jgi:formylglycine-generating enzyme required for sulfatase activity